MAAAVGRGGAAAAFYRESQANEVEALQAMFMEDFVPLQPTAAWGQDDGRTTHFKIRLLPFPAHLSVGSGSTKDGLVNHVSAWLEVTYPLTYPRVPPLLKVLPERGLSNDVVASLLSTLQKDALALAAHNEVMVYQLVQTAQELLRRHNRGGMTTSFHEQMVEHERHEAAQREQMRQLEQRQRELESERQRDHMQQQVEESFLSRRRNNAAAATSVVPAVPGADGAVVHHQPRTLPAGGVPPLPDNQAATSPLRDNEASLGAVFGVRLSGTQSQMATQSRYEHDFEELGLLGRGGFGEVVKARNRIDGQIYAVKKIRLRRNRPALNKKISREVLLIARLHHQYVVRYYQAWVDAAPDDENDSKSERGKRRDSIASPQTKAVRRRSSEAADDDAEADLANAIEKLGLGPNRFLDFGFGEEQNDDIRKGGDRKRDKVETKEREEDETSGSTATFDDDEGDWLSSLDRHSQELGGPDIEGQPMDEGERHEGAEGQEGEGEDDELESENFSPPESSPSQTSSTRHRSSGILYIQMEYCPKHTLKTLIEQGVYGHPETCWRQFRQILEAVAHIHSKGILHRDLKPDNIFIDSQNNIKLGDFGLAVTYGDEDQTEQGQPAKPAKGASGPHGLDTTSEAVGTPFYRAPEQEQTSSREYDFKADMYSLGVILFEMWRPFDTLMERALTLRQLRETGMITDAEIGKLRCPKAQVQVVRQVVESLLRRQPQERPSANQLLHSGLLPLHIEDEYLDMALHAASSRSSAFHVRLMETLFSKPCEDTADYTFEFTSISQMKEGLRQKLTQAGEEQRQEACFARIVQGLVHEWLGQVFRRHGAVPFPTPLLMPFTSKAASLSGESSARSSARLLSDEGLVLQLPHSLTLPFARFAALHPSQVPLRHYDCAPVYRHSSIGGRPRSHLEFDFDILWHGGAPPPGSLASATSEEAIRDALLEGECIRAVHEALAAFPPSVGSFYIRLNHLTLLEVAMEDVLSTIPESELARHVPPALVSSSPPKGSDAGPAAALQRLRTQLMDLAAQQLISSGPAGKAWKSSNMRNVAKNDLRLPAAALERLGSYMQMHSELGGHGAFLKRLKSTLLVRARHLDARRTPPTATTATGGSHQTALVSVVQDALQALEALLKALDTYGISHQVMLDLGLACNHSCYRGRQVFLFCASSNGAPLAIGGRYDALLSQFRLPLSGAEQFGLSGMGANIAVEKLVAALSEHLRSQAASSLSGCLIGGGVLASALPSGSSATDSVPHVPSALRCGALLFGSRNSMLLERATVAAKLWAVGVRAEYEYPRTLTANGARDYCCQLGLRWLVHFRMRHFREQNRVRLRDLCEGDSWQEVHPDNLAELIKPQEAKTEAALHGQVLSRPAVLTHSSPSSSSSSSRHNNLQREVEILHSQQNLKEYQKLKIASQTATALGPVLQNHPPGTFCVVAVDLPIAVIRSVTSEIYGQLAGSDSGALSSDAASSASPVISGSSSSTSVPSSSLAASSEASERTQVSGRRHRKHSHASIEPKQRGGGTKRLVDRLRSWLLSKVQTAQQHAAKDVRLRFVFIFSTLDKRSDMMTL